MANLIKDITVTGSATTTLTLDNLSIQKGELYELVCTFVNPNTDSNIGVFPNDNTTTTNYYTQQISVSGTTISASRTNENKITFAPNNTKVSCYIKLTNDGKLVILAKGMYSIGSNQLQLLDRFVTSVDTFSSVTKLDIISSVANAIGINSRAQLYKVAEKVQDIEITTATTQQDITVDIQKGNEYLLVSDIVNGTGSYNSYNFFINDNNTAGNYILQDIEASSTSVTGARLDKPALIDVGGNIKGLSIANIKLANSGYYNAQSKGFYNYGTSTPLIMNRNMSSEFTVSSITKISIISEVTNAIGINTRFELYKLI